jgi:hypothetical protein
MSTCAIRLTAHIPPCIPQAHNVIVHGLLLRAHRVRGEERPASALEAPQSAPLEGLIVPCHLGRKEFQPNPQFLRQCFDILIMMCAQQVSYDHQARHLH